ncbi:MAG: hypothetical protein HYV35_01705 [Lentisphaerae bacterium]|nr:hypothetical protein [Lentisphaerota bacterium]
MIAKLNDDCFGDRVAAHSAPPTKKRPYIAARGPGLATSIEAIKREFAAIEREIEQRVRDAAISAFIPGLGQVYLGHFLSGVITLAIAVAAWLLATQFWPIGLIHVSAALLAFSCKPHCFFLDSRLVLRSEGLLRRVASGRE